MLNATLTSHRNVATMGALPVALWSATTGAASTAEISAPSLSNAGIFDRETATAEYLSLVRFLARQLHGRLPQHVDLEDLVSAGTLGLLDAVARFDGEKKVQFRSYAQFRIRGAMMDSLRAADWGPRTLRRQGRLLAQAKQELVAAGIHAPDDQDIADHMGVSLATCQDLQNDLNGLALGSLQFEHDDESGEQVLDSVPGPASEDPLFRCLQGELREALTAAIETLPEKERLVLNLLYHEELTMKEISQVLGVVGSRVSQLHTSAIKRLKNSFRGEALCRRTTSLDGATLAS